MQAIYNGSVSPYIGKVPQANYYDLNDPEGIEEILLSVGCLTNLSEFIKSLGTHNTKIKGKDIQKQLPVWSELDRTITHLKPLKNNEGFEIRDRTIVEICRSQFDPLSIFGLAARTHRLISMQKAFKEVLEKLNSDEAWKDLTKFTKEVLIPEINGLKVTHAPNPAFICKDIEEFNEKVDETKVLVEKLYQTAESVKDFRQALETIKGVGDKTNIKIFCLNYFKCLIGKISVDEFKPIRAAFIIPHQAYIGSKKQQKSNAKLTDVFKAIYKAPTFEKLFNEIDIRLSQNDLKSLMDNQLNWEQEIVDLSKKCKS